MGGLKYFLWNESQLEVFDIFMCKFDIRGFKFKVELWDFVKIAAM